MFGKHVFAGPGRNSETQREILTGFEGFLHVHTPCSSRYWVIHSDDFLFEQVPCLHSLSSRRVCVRAKSLQLCPTLCNPKNCSPPGSSVYGTLQARILEWVAIHVSIGSWGKIEDSFKSLGPWLFSVGNNPHGRDLGVTTLLPHLYLAPSSGQPESLSPHRFYCSLYSVLLSSACLMFLLEKNLPHSPKAKDGIITSVSPRGSMCSSWEVPAAETDAFCFS